MARDPGCQATRSPGASPFQIQMEHLRSAICYLRFVAKRRSFPAFVLTEIVVNGRIAFEAPDRAFLVPFSVEIRFEE